MNCKQREDMILLYAADLVEDAGQKQEIRAHLETGCEQCNAALSEARMMVNAIPQSIDPVPPPPGTADRLMERIGQAGSAPMRTVAEPPAIWWPMGIAAGIGLLIGAGALHLYEKRGHDDLLASIAQRDAAAQQAASQVAERDRQLAEMRSLLTLQQLKLVSLAAQNQSSSFARIFWDQQKNEWHLYVIDLKPPAAGRTYELWFIKNDAGNTKQMAAVFNTNSAGLASLVVPVPSNIGPLALVAITDEPAGGSAQPTTTPLLVGSVQ